MGWRHKKAASNELDRIYKDPGTAYALDLSQRFSAKALDRENLQSFLDSLPGEAAPERAKLKKLLANPNADIEANLSTRMGQLVWAAGLDYLSLNIPPDNLRSHAIWRILTRNRIMTDALSTSARLIDISVANRKTTIAYGAPGSGFWFGRDRNHINIDLSAVLKIGIEKAPGTGIHAARGLASMLQEIFHALYTTRFTDRMIALQQREREILDASAERQVTRDEFKEIARIRTEFRLRESMMNAAESNAANHFAVLQGRTLPYEIKRFSNIKQILHDQLRQPEKISAGGREIVEAAESLDMLRKALELAFYSTNGLFDRGDISAWKKFGVDPSRITSPSAAHAGKKDDFDRLMDLAVGPRGLASLQPGNHERWMLQNVFTHSVQSYAERRCEIIDKIWDQYAAHHAGILIDAAADRAENTLNQKEEPDLENDGKEKQATPEKNPGDPSSPDKAGGSPSAKDKNKPEDSAAPGEDKADAAASPEKADDAQEESGDTPVPDSNPGDSKSPEKGQEKKKDDSQPAKKKPSGAPPPDKKAGAAPDQDKQEQDDPAAPDKNSGDPSSQQSESDEMSPSQGSDEDSPSPGGQEQGQGSESSDSEGGESQESEESGSPSQDDSDDAPSSAGDGQGSKSGQPGQQQSGQGQGTDDPGDPQESDQQRQQEGNENSSSPENSGDSPSSQGGAQGGGKRQSSGQSQSGGEESDEDGSSVDVEGLGPIDIGGPLPETPEESRKADREDDDLEPEDMETVHDLAREARKQEEQNKKEQNSEGNIPDDEASKTPDAPDSGNMGDDDTGKTGRGGDGQGIDLARMARGGWTNLRMRINEMEPVLGPITQDFIDILNRQRQPARAVLDKREEMPRGGDIARALHLKTHMNYALQRAAGQEVKQQYRERWKVDEIHHEPTSVELWLIGDGSGSMNKPLPSGGRRIDSSSQAMVGLYEVGKRAGYNTFCGMFGDDQMRLLAAPGDMDHVIGDNFYRARNGIGSGSRLSPSLYQAIQRSARQETNARGEMKPFAGMTHFMILSDGELDIYDIEPTADMLIKLFQYGPPVSVDIALLGREGSQMEKIVARVKQAVPSAAIDIVKAYDARKILVQLAGKLKGRFERSAEDIQAMPDAEKRDAFSLVLRLLAPTGPSPGPRQVSGHNV
jgi:hypothetical protein